MCSASHFLFEVVPMSNRPSGGREMSCREMSSREMSSLDQWDGVNLASTFESNTTSEPLSGGYSATISRCSPP